MVTNQYKALNSIWKLNMWVEWLILISPNLAENPKNSWTDIWYSIAGRPFRRLLLLLWRIRLTTKGEYTHLDIGFQPRGSLSFVSWTMDVLFEHKDDTDSLKLYPHFPPNGKKKTSAPQILALEEADSCKGKKNQSTWSISARSTLNVVQLLLQRGEEKRRQDNIGKHPKSYLAFHQSPVGATCDTVVEFPLLQSWPSFLQCLEEAVMMRIRAWPASGAKMEIHCSFCSDVYGAFYDGRLWKEFEYPSSKTLFSISRLALSSH